jgi:TPR repeat protein
LGDTNAMWKLIQNGNIGSTNFSGIDPATGLPMIQPNAEGVRWLQKLANGGDTEAMVEIGNFYLSETNTVEGLNWLQKAADLGDMTAWTTLASIYELGNNGVTKVIEQAIAWYTKAATNGDNSSAIHLAQIYRDNEDVKNPQESFKWFLQVAKQSDSNTNSWDTSSINESTIGVAKAYDQGLGVDQNKAEAIKWYTKAAEAGVVEGQWRLGVKYDLGDGVDTDKLKALKWYLKAANAPQPLEKMGIVSSGVAEAQRNLGYLYLNGEGVAKDDQEAFEWFLKAAENGDSESQCEVAKSYINGIGVLQDRQEAFNWYQKAAYLGSKRAQQKLGSIYTSANPNLPENRIEAYKWYTLAAAQGDEDAAKFRDIIQPLMSVQELAEASRRAKAFSLGEPPITNTVPVVSQTPTYDVWSITAKPTEQNDVWWRFGYRLTVQNKGLDTEKQRFEIQFLDAQGYVIDTATTDQIAIKPGTTEIITGETLVNLPGAAQVSKLKAIWKQ